MRVLLSAALVTVLVASVSAQGFWNPPAVVPELSSTSSDYYPFISADLLTARVASSRNDLTPPPAPAGGWHLWRATRPNRFAPFGPLTPEPGALQTSVNDLAPWVSGDDLTFYMASPSPSFPTSPVGGVDIWEFTRTTPTSPWVFASNVTAVNTTSTDYMPSCTSDNLELYATASNQIVCVKRGAPNAPWSAAIPITAVAGHGHSGVSGNGLELYTAQGGNLFVTRRPSRSKPWGTPVALAGVNNQASGVNNRPSLSVDGRELFFSSSRPANTPGVGSTSVWRSTWTGLSIEGRPLIGQAMKIHITHASKPAGAYQIAMSWTNTGIPIPGVGSVPLAPDDLFVLSVTNKLPSVFVNFQGNLDGQGEATAVLNTPNIPALIGIPFFLAGIASSGGPVDYITNGIALEFDL